MKKNPQDLIDNKLEVFPILNRVKSIKKNWKSYMGENNFSVEFPTMCLFHWRRCKSYKGRILTCSPRSPGSPGCPLRPCKGKGEDILWKVNPFEPNN